MSDELDYRNDPELLALETKRLETLLKLRKVYKENGLAFYAPHYKQQWFHEAAGYYLRYARTGNRFGKSQMGAAEDVAFAIGERTWYPKGDARRKLGIPKAPTKGLIICVDWDKAEEIFTNLEGDGELGKLIQYIPNGALKSWTKNHSGYVDKLIIARPNELGGGYSTIALDTVQSYKQNKLSMESSVWDYIHVDEPCPKDMFTAAARGLVDRQGRAWFTCTPLAEAWINDLFVPNRRTEVSEVAPFIKDDDTWMMVGSMEDNPYNTPEAIAKFLKLLNPEEIECRKNGKPLSMAGVVYKEFDHNLHILRSVPHGWDDWDTPPKNYTIRVSIDPHPQTPHAVVFIATSPEGYKFVFHVIFEPVLINELCSMIKAHTQGYYVQDSLIDPAANTKDPVTGENMIEEFFRNGVFADPATKDLSAGILAVKRQLRERTPAGRPTIYFSPRLDRMFYEFDHYNWKPDSSNKPIDKDDHTLECFYRLCLRGLHYVEPPSENAYARLAARDIEDIIDEEVPDDVLVNEVRSNRRNNVDFGSMRRKPKTVYPDSF